MENPLSFLTRKNLETSVGVLQSRFPVASIMVVILAGLFFYIVQAEPTSLVYLRICLSLIVTFFVSVGLSLFLEGKKIPYGKLWHVAPIVYGILFYMSINPMTNEWMIDSITYFILHLVGFIGLLFFAPYCRELFYDRPKSVEYTNYFSHVAWTLFMSVIVGGSLVALGFIAIASVDELFDLSSLVAQYNLYENWAIIALSLVAPLYTLIHLPVVETLEKETYEINRFFSFLIRFITTPFIVLYFIILYAYSAKVLLNFQDWPKGVISWMVISFSSFGYLTYIFSQSYAAESQMVTWFRQYFPYAVPAQILMLGYAIYLRINQYDLTMNRYFVVIFGCWLALVSVYYILSRRKSLTIISASLSIIALVVSVGPWSVYRLPLTRQYNHLIHNLEVAGMYKDGVISEKQGTLDTALENDIYSEISYICGFSRCEKIKTLFAKELAGKEEAYEKTWRENSALPGIKTVSEEPTDDQVYPGMSSWEIIKEVTDALGISYKYPGSDGETPKYISLRITNNYNDSIYPLDISGYQTIAKIYSSEYPAADRGLSLSVNPDTALLQISGLPGGTKSVSLASWNDSLAQKYTSDTYNLAKSDLTHTITIDDMTIQLIFSEYTLKNKKYTSSDSATQYTAITGYALIKN